jgi:O-acetyl-ADP-ribose deacetylase (regulator of RNase III)
MTSIAIPSLGAGKLGYPHHIIADILFTEVLVFNQQHPAFLQKVVFVLSEKEIYESFMKVYVQQLCVCSSEEVEPLQMEGKVGGSQKMSTRLFIQHGNIEDEKVDVIVNPTTHNADLSSNAVSRAISKKAGKGLQALCCQLSENGVVLNEKNSVFTKASGQLHCKKVLHVYTPIKDPAQTDDNDVNSIVQSVALDALSRTEKEGYKSMALPLLGFGYPVEGRAMAVIKACLEFGQSVPLSMNQIILVVSNECHFEKVYSCLTALKGDSSALEEGERENYVLEVHPHSQMASKHVFRTLQPWTVADLKTLENKDAVVKAYSVFPEQSNLVIQN